MGSSSSGQRWSREVKTDTEATADALQRILWYLVTAVQVLQCLDPGTDRHHASRLTGGGVPVGPDRSTGGALDGVGCPPSGIQGSGEGAERMHVPYLDS